MGDAVGRGVILDFCMDFGVGRPFEGESYLVFVWTLGEGGAPDGKGVVLDLCMDLGGWGGGGGGGSVGRGVVLDFCMGRLLEG